MDTGLKMSVVNFLRGLQEHPEIFALFFGGILFTLFKLGTWLDKLKYNHSWVYGDIHLPTGTCINPARLNKTTGKCEFILWKAGEQGHINDYWHATANGHERFFKSTE